MSTHLLIMTAVTKITTTTMIIMKIAMTTIEATIPIKESLVFLIDIHGYKNLNFNNLPVLRSPS